MPPLEAMVDPVLVVMVTSIFLNRVHCVKHREYHMIPCSLGLSVIADKNHGGYPRLSMTGLRIIMTEIRPA